MPHLRHILLIALLSTSLTAIAQKYTPAQLEGFTQVYWEMKNFTVPDSLKRVPGITDERLGQLITSRINGQPMEMTPEEQAALLVLEERIDDDLASRVAILESLCESHELSVDTYRSILRQYHTDIAFQRELQPYFKAYFNSNK